MPGIRECVRRVPAPLGDPPEGATSLAELPPPFWVPSPVGTHYEDQTFENAMIDVDGKVFRRCRFVNCQLVTRGLGGGGVNECYLDENTRLLFAGPAQTTLALLWDCYHSNDEATKEWVEAIIDAIRGDTPPPGHADGQVTAADTDEQSAASPEDQR